MRIYLRKLLLLSVFFLFLSGAWAQTNSVNLDTGSTENEEVLTIDKYLNGYIANNLELKQLKLEVEEALANLDEVNIGNDINVTASSGSSTVTIDDNDVELGISPSVTVTIPGANNTVVTTSVPVSVSSDSASGTYFSGAGLSVSREIISETADEYQLNVEGYERALFEAQLAVETKIISLKSEFWNALYDIYSADKIMKENSDDLYDDQIDFDTIKAQGYSETSSTYRTAQLEVKEDAFAVEKAKRDLETLLGGFSVACGLHPGDIGELPAISDNYYSLTLAEFEDYNIGGYIDFEDAVQDYEYQKKVLAADSDFSLSAGAGYDYTGYSDYSSNNINNDEGNKLSTNLSASYGGLTTSVGISTLLEEPAEPSLTFSFSYDFGTHKTDEIDDRKDDIDLRTKLLAIDSAKESWIEDNLEFSSTKATLEWTRAQNAEQLALYKEMYEDSQRWFEDGIIARTDLLKAKNSYETKIDDSILTIIDCITYNFGIEKLFIGGLIK